MMPLHTAPYYSYSTPSSPSAASQNQQFDFPVAIPPRLKNIGRRISQMSNDFLPPGIDEEVEERERQIRARAVAMERAKRDLKAQAAAGVGSAASSVAPGQGAVAQVEQVAVPGMGDEPVMCPFCDKPLPPSLFAAQLGTGEHVHAHTHERRPSRPAVVRTNTAPPLPTTSSPAPTPAPAPAPAAPVEPPVPKATAEELAAGVKEGDTANHAAAENLISESDIARWSTLAGISPPDASPIPPVTKPSATPSPAPTSTPVPAPAPSAKETKAFPLLPPPPAPASKLTKAPPAERAAHGSGSSGKSGGFGFFRRGSAKKDEEDEESSDDDGGAGGYTRLMAQGSPSDDEGDEAMERIERGRGEGGKKDAEVKEEKKKEEPEVEAKDFVEEEKKGEKAEEKAVVAEVKEIATKSGDDDVRKVLQEVLGRVNEMSKSHTALLNSHSSLLTSLKIARSNLAMAEANSEMLEAQLKQVPAPPPSGRIVSGPASSPITATSAGGLKPQRSTDQRSVSTSGTPRTPVGSSLPARASLDEKPRPTALHLPSNAQPGNTGALSASAADSGKSWGFWNGGKKKLPGGLGNITVPSPAQMMAHLPGTPGGGGGGESRTSGDYFRAITSPSAAPYSTALPDDRPRPVRTATHSGGGGQSPGVSKSLNEGSNLGRSLSFTNVPSAAGAGASRGNVPTQELAKLRQAYSAAVAKMDAMSKELAELKKGKVEMEEELEGLSQALFEEANKMVADERRKRAEMEENLKEVREEREALRETIKVLGGKVEVPEPAESASGQEGEEEAGKESSGVKAAATPESFAPRDLDKHFEALHKAIHHVHDGPPSTTTTPLTSPPAAASHAPASPSIPTSLINPLPTPLLHSAVPALGSIPISRTSTATPPMDIPSRPVSVSLPAETNPWAMSLEDADAGLGPAVQRLEPHPEIDVTVTTPSPNPVGELTLDGVESSGAGGRKEDTSGEGELPNMAPGLGLEMSGGVGGAGKGPQGGAVQA
ncbi:hypothetical protein IAT38_007522 [Cryptococcus sp. DSM 104549]